jgi:succinoglycan biosynthesis transport protein ExoP
MVQEEPALPWACVMRLTKFGGSKMEEDTDLSKRGVNNRSLQVHVEPSVVQSLVQDHFAAAVGGEGEDLRDNLRDYWCALRRHLWLVVSITILATLAMAVYEANEPDLYEAKSRIEIGQENVNSGGNAIVSEPANDSVYFNTQLQILNSSGLLRRVVKTLDLEHNPAFLHPGATVKHSTWQSFLRMVGLGGKEGERPAPKDEVLLTTSVAPATSREDLAEAKRLEPYVRAILQGLKVEPIKETRTEVKETRLIDVSFSHDDPQITAKVVNAIADALVYMNLERKVETSAKAGDFLQKRIVELQTEIRRGEERLINYGKNNQIISLDGSQNTAVERLAGLNRELLEAENERHQAEAAYQTALAPGAVEAMAREKSNNGQSKLYDLRMRRAELLVENTEEWPEVKVIDKQIAELEKQIQSASTALLKNLETRYQQTLAREQFLRDSFNRQRNTTIAQNEAAVNYKIIQQEIETNKGILQVLLQHAKENDIAQAGLSNSVHVIDYASAPDQPVRPQQLRNIGLAFILSLGFAIASALTLKYFDNTIRSVSDAEKKLHLPALAVVPSVGGVVHHRFHLPATGSPLQLNGDGRDRQELLINNPGSAIAEVYRHLRASLLVSRGGCAVTSLLVTSSLPGEGKTTTAINTALSLAEAGANVLLVDGDLRRPSLHMIFEVSNERGLSTALSNGLAGSELLALIKRPEMSGLSLLTSGPLRVNPAKLLDRETLRRLMAILEANFTHIIIDSPPIFPFADSVLLSAEVDGVLLVVQGGKSPQEVVLRSKKLLDDVDALTLGVVINNTELQPFDNYYQKYCRQYYKKSEAKAAGLSADTL